MIGVLFADASAVAGQYVLAAVRRSVSVTQAQPISRSALRSIAPAVVVAIDVPEEWGADLFEWLSAQPRKLVLFGRVPSALARDLNYETVDWPAELEADSRSEAAPSREARESHAVVRYTHLVEALGGQTWDRPFERFDFTDEWNNLGYGRIRHDGSIWAVAQAGQVASDAELASVHVAGGRRFSYAALWDADAASVLWINRPVGPCDSFEWRIVENFLSGYRAQALPCQPVLSEIPWGFDAAITSRLDCDESVEAARPLWQAYQRLGVPFTLAVHTQNLIRPEEHAILWELLVDQGQGAVLSHTATHAPNWGGSYEAALEEGRQSAQALQIVTGNPVRYAVSPFHQSPPYALRALADAGYEGCVGGIIRNDPEFVLARGGALAGLPEGFVGHSQQCMLHGDCMLAVGDPLAVFKRAFDLAYDTQTLFGYLDHPFSPRYQYGWPDEAARIEAHEQFIEYIRSRAQMPVFMTEAGALDFLKFKSQTQVIEEDGGFRVLVPTGMAAPYSLGVEFRGAYEQVESGERLQ
ncbi:polysaccharide deacetylase family protein [Paraburkholderia sp. RP-4-7]|uniref:Polysaccharide deacetylase family protein n=1 Tax=Paraburkholderia polaris TaxID=2728848 RepID=A0A848IQZ4_9BURK|nr:polysaccharide deacetylase family protein [Paraburkholderia polaris]NMM02224.1 polysaccharide deacetylase family protein [Paraburkholderia polaris]